ncbi:MAG: hypothetical protein D6704_10030 [Nitrospirae bacterium]|nr:MAG: hypothetical protein D6704_10030 [Nitrospirota bacterium]
MGVEHPKGVSLWSITMPNAQNEPRLRWERHLEAVVPPEMRAALNDTGVADQAAELWEELYARSERLAIRALDALPDVLRRCGEDLLVPWLDLAVSLAASSGATTMKYLRESPWLLGMMETVADRQAAVHYALELADAPSEVAANCAYEFLRHAPELVSLVGREQLARWAEIGLALAEANYVVGIEFFRESPKIAAVLDVEQVRDWVEWGMKLIVLNSLGKPDYVGTLEFFRTSPQLLAALPDRTCCPLVIRIGSRLADQSPEKALAFLADIGNILQRISPPSQHRMVLHYGAQVAERSAAATLAYFQRCPELFHQMAWETEDREIAQVFEVWVHGGLEVLEYSIEGAVSYFSLETARALTSVEKALQGVALRHVRRSLTWFARLICGEEIAIEPLVEEEVIPHASPHQSDAHSIGRGRPVFDLETRTLYLPVFMNRYAELERNFRWYTVMTAHEVGHVAFGTYCLDASLLQKMAQAVAKRYGRLPGNGAPVTTLADLFDLYPQPGMIQDLWTILEDARIDARLQHEYPGLGSDLAVLSKELAEARSLLHGMSVREMVIEALLVKLVHGGLPPAFPRDLYPLMDQAWARAQAIQAPEATPEDTVRIADQIYEFLEQSVGTVSLAASPQAQTLDPRDQTGSSTIALGPRAAEETTALYRPVTNWAYRGTLRPDWVGEKSLAGEETVGTGEEGRQPRASTGQASPRQLNTESNKPGKPASLAQEALQEEHASEAQPLKQWLQGGEVPGTSRWTREGRVFLYPEWDYRLQDYRVSWCQVVEHVGAQENPDRVRAILEHHAPLIRTLRRYFEAIRPETWRRCAGQPEGEDLDMNAVIQQAVDQKAGIEPTDRLYIRRDKRERRVAVALLIDLSGSTGRQIESGAGRVIDVEQEGLVLLAEALEAIGDHYALYGFSGQGRDDVRFIVLKDFAEPWRLQGMQRIAAISPQQQNRDGAAIRHATYKLLCCEARHRVLLVLSDGKPLDDGYLDEYALEDTKRALSEARQAGVVPFCLTIDHQAPNYLARMYRDVHFVVLKDVNQLPDRLPGLYRRVTRV